MPSHAYALVALFSVIALVCGAGAIWLVGPRRLAAIVVPALAAFLALYWVGHRSGLELGPMVELLGFQVAIVQDVLAAALAAAAAAVVQRWAFDRWHARRGTTSEAP